MFNLGDATFLPCPYLWDNIKDCLDSALMTEFGEAQVHAGVVDKDCQIWFAAIDFSSRLIEHFAKMQYSFGDLPESGHGERPEVEEQFDVSKAHEFAAQAKKPKPANAGLKGFEKRGGVQVARGLASRNEHRFHANTRLRFSMAVCSMRLAKLSAAVASSPEIRTAVSSMTLLTNELISAVNMSKSG